jgi:hypothetical protein
MPTEGSLARTAYFFDSVESISSPTRGGLDESLDIQGFFPKLSSIDPLGSSGWGSSEPGASFSGTRQFESQLIKAWLELSGSIGLEGRSKLRPLEWEVLGELVAHGVEHFPVRLADALRDLGGVKEEAGEAGFPTPTEVACKNANRMLKEMYRLSRRRFEVYPMPDGEIAIDASDGQGSSVLLLCDSDGGALCLVNMRGQHRRARYSSADALPDGFVREALAELELQSD